MLLDQITPAYLTLSLFLLVLRYLQCFFNRIGKTGSSMLTVYMNIIR